MNISGHIRRWLLFIIGFALVVILFLWVNASYKMIDMSSLDVVVGKSLSLDSVQIRRGFYSGNRASDLELFDGQRNDRLIFDGRQLGLLDTDYGENDFLVIYGDRYYCQFRHFIFNSNHQHDYRFLIDRRGGSLYLTVDVNGPDAEDFESVMLSKDSLR